LGPSISGLFLGLAISQAAHSIEEFCFQLFEVFAPARYLSGLVSDNLAFGFAAINSLIVACIFWTYFFRVRPGTRNATAWVWAWSLLELANGFGHFVFTADVGAYYPGVLTAPFLLLFSVALIYRLVHPVGRAPVH
jgi:hypothetical protein